MIEKPEVLTEEEMNRAYMKATGQTVWDGVKYVAEAQRDKDFPETIKAVLDSVEVAFEGELFKILPLSKYEDTIALLNLKRKKWTDFRQALQELGEK